MNHGWSVLLAMLIGAVFGACSVMIGAILIAKRSSEFDQRILDILTLMRLHLGRSSMVAGEVDGTGWRIIIRCMGCGRKNRLKEGAIAGAKCGACHVPFKDSGDSANSGGGAVIVGG